MEIEENRGLINKKAYEDHFMAFVNLTFVSFSLQLSLYSLSYSCTLRAFLEHPSIGKRKEKEWKEIKREENIKQIRVGSSGYNEITCKYRVAHMISLLFLACMVHACLYLVLLLSMT